MTTGTSLKSTLNISASASLSGGPIKKKTEEKGQNETEKRMFFRSKRTKRDWKKNIIQIKIDLSFFGIFKGF
ncbi:hypothetical protein [Methanosarcina sp. 1.H.A.2.2]|uniref:hypothetical protein n=1 Tax=Methanosarcina sp. 1.H.A.2.2 TaxID=1483601 RepID=UPI0012E04E26|nr:hypothetical protein [Methanosarcina sp. 1.H.A.2.2]